MIHTNNSPKSIPARVCGRSRLKKRALFLAGRLGQTLEVFETLPEAFAERDRLIAAGGAGAVLVMRIQTAGEGHAKPT